MSVHSHSGNNLAVTRDFISPTWLGRLKFFYPAKGRCCSQVLRGGATECGVQGHGALLPGGAGLSDPAAEKGSAAPGESPRPRLQGPRRAAWRVPALPGRPASPLVPGRGVLTAQTPCKSLQRSPAAPIYSPLVFNDAKWAVFSSSHVAGRR